MGQWDSGLFIELISRKYDCHNEKNSISQPDILWSGIVSS
jgi:hypothetical protein